MKEAIKSFLRFSWRKELVFLVFIIANMGLIFIDKPTTIPVSPAGDSAKGYGLPFPFIHITHHGVTNIPPLKSKTISIMYPNLILDIFIGYLTSCLLINLLDMYRKKIRKKIT